METQVLFWGCGLRGDRGNLNCDETANFDINASLSSNLFPIMKQGKNASNLKSLSSFEQYEVFSATSSKGGFQFCGLENKHSAHKVKNHPYRQITETAFPAAIYES